MRNIYIAVAAFLLLSLLLFVLSFVFLDITKHKTYYYIVNADGRDIGTIRADKFITEDKLIYKSAASMPCSPQFTEYRTRLDLDRKYTLESFTKERMAGRATDLVYIENFRNMASFVSRFQSKFACVDGIPVKRGTFVFEEDSPVTYIPLIENYNFIRGRSQGFNALIPAASFSMPPMKRFVILTSIRDEYVKIGKRKIKTENLVVKIRDYPQANIWVSKADMAIIRIEIPSQKLKITRTFGLNTLRARQYRPRADGYAAREVTVKSRSAELSGSLAIPSGKGPFPAVLLVWGQGAQDRYYQGLFASIADYLAKNGFCVLSLDKRGVGSSSGDIASTTAADIVDDIDAGVSFLANQPQVDAGMIALIGHGRGAAYAMKTVTRSEAVRGMILMSPSIGAAYDTRSRLETLKAAASRARWNDEYLSLAARTLEETDSKVLSAKGSWSYILGKKCFMGSMREEMGDKPLETIRGVKVPVLILQGGKDDEAPAESGSYLDKALSDAGNQARTLTYYAYLGPFLGEAVNDGIHRIHYEADKQVLENIKSWLNKLPAQAPRAPEKAPPEPLVPSGS